MMRSFLIATQFMTRLPVPKSLIGPELDLGRATAFFPLVGIIVGGGGALLYAGLKPFLPNESCVVLVLIYLALITNGIHEDGFADSMDGFGGGWTRDRTLEIMRDSRIGTFGALGLIFLVLAKYNLLSALDHQQVWRWLIFAHAASRWTTLPLSMWLPYAREHGQGGLVAQRIGWREMTIATAMTVAASLLLPWPVALCAIAVTAAIVFISGLYYRRRLKGITGDCMGATNQIAEVALYLAAVISSKAWNVV